MIILFIFLITSTANLACDSDTGSVFKINKDVRVLGQDRSESTLKAHRDYRLRVLGNGPGWGCLVQIIGSNGDAITNERLQVSDANLRSLERESEVNGDAVDAAVRLSIIEAINSSDEVANAGEAPCAGCIHLESSLRPRLRPANLNTTPRPQRSNNGRVPIGELGISDKGINFIMGYEGFSGVFYEDGTRTCTRRDASRVCSTGEEIGIPTIGYGVQIQDEREFDKFCRETLKNNGCQAAKVEWLKVLKGGSSGRNIINERTAEELMRYEIGILVRDFQRDYPNIKLKQSEFDALISLKYNAKQFFRLGHDSNFNAVLRTPNFNLIDLASHMYDIGPYAGNYRRRLDEINLLLLGTYEPITASNDVTIPNDRRLRNLYKEMVEFWDEERGRRFWRSNPSYNYFINKVKNL